jgi:hypothetical protein
VIGGRPGDLATPKNRGAGVFRIALFFIIVSGPHLLAPSMMFADPPVPSASVDLDKDGTIDNVSLSGVKESGEFVLHVNRISREGKLIEGRADGLLIVDVDAADRYREIAVHTPGASDDDEYLVYSYDGKSLKEMGRLSRWPKFIGNGIVLVDGWMGFWKKREKYVLDKTARTLRRVPQEVYHVGAEATVRESFPMYHSREHSDIVARVRPGSKVLILVCDPSPECKTPEGEADDYYCDWYLLRSVTGLTGWARLRSFWDKVEGLPWAD